MTEIDQYREAKNISTGYIYTVLYKKIKGMNY